MVAASATAYEDNGSVNLTRTQRVYVLGAILLVSLTICSRNFAPRYRCRGRFFGRRVDCERVPMLPSKVVRMVVDDPRNIRANYLQALQDVARADECDRPPLPPWARR